MREEVVRRGIGNAHVDCHETADSYPTLLPVGVQDIEDVVSARTTLYSSKGPESLDGTSVRR